jgi:hypothetical protein
MEIVRDPFGNEVVLQESVLDFSDRLRQSDDVFDGVGKVIEKPLMVFRSSDGGAFFYFRAVGWNTTLLLDVQKADDHFEVARYEMNPPVQRLSDLHQRTERLL